MKLLIQSAFDVTVYPEDKDEYIGYFKQYTILHSLNKDKNIITIKAQKICLNDELMEILLAFIDTDDVCPRFVILNYHGNNTFELELKQVKAKE